MIYGHEYGAGSSDCRRCEAHSPNLTIAECYMCGDPGCERCLIMQVSEADRQTGYRDERYVCERCDDEAKAEAAEMHSEECRAVALALCGYLRESLRKAEGAD